MAESLWLNVCMHDVSILIGYDDKKVVDKKLSITVLINLYL